VPGAVAEGGCAEGEGQVDLAECDAGTLSTPGCEPIRQLVLPDALPPARGNQYADDDAAAYLGFGLFFASNLGTGVSCAKCHLPELTFTDRKPVATGKGVGRRNTPTTLNSGRLGVMFWDGMADSLWSQPLFAIENPVEMGSSRLEVAHTIAGDDYLRPLYETAFGPLPDMSAWPAAGKPGDPAFDALAAGTKDAVNAFTAKIGKAFEAYMRKNTSGRAPFDDYYLGGDPEAIIPEARAGVRAFVERGCVDCHSGPMMTDEKFHRVGFPSLPGAEPDRGRAGAIAVLRDNVFNLAGPYADPGSAPDIPSEPAPADEGAFRTPSLRNVVSTAPYGHDGALETLGAVLDVHAPEIVDPERGHLIAFLLTLNGATPPRPWSNWPKPQ
jgi:cytochrome c peroxidase